MLSRLLVAMLVAIVPATPALAQNATDRVEALFAEGAALYRAGKYKAAIEKFDAAYSLYPVPNLLYNKGRAHEALGELQLALDAYQRCARAQDVEPDVQKKANRRATLVKNAIRLSTTAPGEAPNARLAAPPPDSGPKAITYTKWIAAGLAVALVAGGGIAYAAGASDHSSVSDASRDAGGGVASLTRAEAQQLSDDGTTKKTVGVALMGGGAAAALGALIAFVLDDDSDDAQAWRLNAGEDGMAVSWSGSF